MADAKRTQGRYGSLLPVAARNTGLQTHGETAVIGGLPWRGRRMSKGGVRREDIHVRSRGRGG